MARKKQVVIKTPEDQVLLSWLHAEQWHLNGGSAPTNTPMPEPHPNQVATRAAVAAGSYTAEDVGLDDQEGH